MSNWYFDEDTMIALVVGLAAAVCVAFAVRQFRAGRPIVGVVWSIGAAVLAFVTWYFAVFTIRMF
ncbi:MAG: hypothetical protein KBA31_19210 [Alphaproteobacteria bacterium]|nr:hypothetical protein [Alphaproteobacteria bacterium]